MKPDPAALALSPLFDRISESELDRMLGCLNASLKQYAKGNTIFFAGDPAVRVGVVLTGEAQVVRDDLFGNRTILANLAAGDLFGETFACAGVQVLPVGVLATSPCSVLLLDYRKIIRTCSSDCAFHSRLVENMMRILAQKNLLLSQKIEVLSARTTREKLLAYLSSQASRAGSSSFTIPFSRQALADYLCVDRSAMSAELGRMRDDGLLSFHKNRFELPVDAHGKQN